MLRNASHPSRHLFLISAAVSLLVGGLGGTAAAKDCTSDLDCDTGYQCAFAQTGTGTTGGGVSSSGTAGAGGGAASTGAGAATGSTCAAGVDNCGTTSSPPTKVPAMDAGAAPILAVPDAGPLLTGPVPTPAVTGICQPKPIVCTTVADCPTPLVCQAEPGTCSGGATVGPDGTVTTTTNTCTPGTSVCAWVPLTCTADTGCADPLYQCVKVGESSWCSGSSGTCAAGATCPPSSPTICGTTAIMNCMPKPIDCGAGQACPAGWSCFDFSNYNGGIRPTWSPNAPDKSCLPDGIILWTQGHASGGGQSAGSGENGGGLGSTDFGGAGGAGGKRGPGSDANPPAVSPVSSTGGAPGSASGDNSAGATVHSSGCALGGSDSGPLSLWLALAMAGLVARLALRRHRARS